MTLFWCRDQDTDLLLRFVFNSPDPKAHGELIGWYSSRRPASPGGGGGTLRFSLYIGEVDFLGGQNF